MVDFKIRVCTYAGDVNLNLHLDNGNQNMETVAKQIGCTLGISTPIDVKKEKIERDHF